MQVATAKAQQLSEPMQIAASPVNTLVNALATTPETALVNTLVSSLMHPSPPPKKIPKAGVRWNLDQK